LLRKAEELLVESKYEKRDVEPLQEIEELIIEAGRAEKYYWRDLWRYRELFYFLSWRDILVRYKQTELGIAWALIQPLLMMIVFSVIFGTIAKLPAGGVPYPILVFSALLPWQLFAGSLTASGNSLVNNANLLSKVYFPRLIVPGSAIVVSLVDFLVSGIILLGLMIWYEQIPTWRFITLPIFILIACATALGAGLWLAALTVKYRDFRYVVPFIVQLGFFVSPIGFSSDLIPEKWRLLYSLNPMVGVIDGFRWAILGGDTKLNLLGFSLSLTIVLVLLASGIAYFRKIERTFADVI
jgi:lipopolysaccharide transport system permease protein